MKTIILMRHSIPNRDEKDTISEEGILLAEKMKETMPFGFDHVYSSPFNRAIETAEVFSSDIKVIQTLKEREIGIAKEDFWMKQYLDHNFKNEDGESLNDVKCRMKRAMDSMLARMDEGECSLVLSHATAICAYLMNDCVVNVVEAKSKKREVIFRNQKIDIENFRYASYFVLEFDDNDLVTMKYCDSKDDNES